MSLLICPDGSLKIETGYHLLTKFPEVQFPDFNIKRLKITDCRDHHTAVWKSYPPDIYTWRSALFRCLSW